MRHASPPMTAWYTKTIPEEVRAAVESMDAELWSKEREEQVQ